MTIDYLAIALTAAGAVALLVAGAALFAWFQRVSDRKTRLRRTQIAQRGENRATNLLAHAGYRILEQQARRTWSFEADGQRCEALLIADFVVEYRGARFVADAKTGAAASLRQIETRRQLLEYQIAFDVEAVLLLDMERERIITVRFPCRRR